MGMYNEVHKNCYNCGSRCTIQIPQIVLGFGDFDLEDPQSETIQSLTIEQKLLLKKYVEQEVFYCTNHTCDKCDHFLKEIYGGSRCLKCGFQIPKKEEQK